jgi:uncharacterized membrane protein
MRKANILVLAVILVSFIIGIVLYPSMPEKMASHWNEKNEVNGYMPKFWGLFLMPIISVILFGLFLLIPKIDPMKKNIEKFRKYFDNFMILIFLFMFYIYTLTLLWNSGYRFSMISLMSPAFAVLFYYAGVLIQNAKQNWFIGIRTPWTLSNEKVWDKTHKIGGKMFKISGILSLGGIFSGNYAIFFVLVPIIFTAIFTLVYSYVVYVKIKK